MSALDGRFSLVSANAAPIICKRAAGWNGRSTAPWGMALAVTEWPGSRALRCFACTVPGSRVLGRIGRCARGTPVLRAIRTSVIIIRSREPAMTDLTPLQRQSRNVLHVWQVLRVSRRLHLTPHLMPHSIPVHAQTPQPPDPPFNPDPPPPPSPQEPPDTIPDPTREPPSPPSQPIGDPPPGPNETPHVSHKLH